MIFCGGQNKGRGEILLALFLGIACPLVVYPSPLTEDLTKEI